MIVYDFGDWGIGFVWSLKGSVFPKSVALALPNAIVSSLLHFLLRLYAGSSPEIYQGMAIWSSYTFVLGFLLVFRTQIAYSRFWEGGNLLQQVRGVWFNATSNLVAFTNPSPEKRTQVEAFEHLLVRLMSMLHCSALQQIAVMQDEHYEILGDAGIQIESLRYLSGVQDRCEVIMQWIQRLIVNNMASQVLPIAPPILSRVFQELSNGIVDVQSASRITQFQFPFPYAQMLTVMLLLHWMFTPIISAALVGSNLAAAIMTFCATFSLWSINYIAAELEMPFGDDPNDLPIENMQKAFNRSLRTLLDEHVKTPPKFEFDPRSHRTLYCVKSRLTARMTDDASDDMMDSPMEVTPKSAIISVSQEPCCDSLTEDTSSSVGVIRNAPLLPGPRQDGGVCDTPAPTPIPIGRNTLAVASGGSAGEPSTSSTPSLPLSGAKDEIVVLNGADPGSNVNSVPACGKIVSVATYNGVSSGIGVIGGPSPMPPTYSARDKDLVADPVEMNILTNGAGKDHVHTLEMTDVLLGTKDDGSNEIIKFSQPVTPGREHWLTRRPAGVGSRELSSDVPQEERAGDPIPLSLSTLHHATIAQSGVQQPPLLRPAISMQERKFTPRQSAEIK
eukprot:TRINITY_DN25062_c0_g1_i2.p1 TRINITY_DN25062_c0_g1~~TRINITY_DN25062_c0_g1_i2.p1  ORF type:complete len:616 (+),score=86.25 TRINITY_DN25062_c0_g1_i2:154-2001(+)